MSRPRSAGQIFLHIVSPSWFEFILSILIAIGIAGSLVTIAISRDQQLSQYVAMTTQNVKQASKNEQNTPIGQSSKQIVDTVNSSQLIGNATVFVLWALIGLLVYVAVNALWQKAKREVSFFERLSFFKNDRASILETTIEGLAVRLTAAVALIGFLALFRYIILPQVLAMIYEAFSATGYQAAISVVLGIFVLIICLHVTVVLVRLSLLRTRVFFTKYSAVD